MDGRRYGAARQGLRNAIKLRQTDRQTEVASRPAGQIGGLATARRIVKRPATRCMLVKTNGESLPMDREEKKTQGTCCQRNA